MRSHAFFALACFGVVGLTLPSPADAQEQGSVTVAKQTASSTPAPQRLAPPQDQPDQSVSSQASPAPPVETAPVVQSVTAPTEVKTETYLRPPVPAIPATAARSAPPAAEDGSQADPQGGFASPDRLMDWISNYRDHKQPWRVPASVHAMKAYGMFGDEEKEWFCIGFIAGVLGTNPKDGPAMIPKMFPMPDKEQAVIIRAVAYSGRPDWRELLEKNASRMPLRKPLIDD